MAKLSQLLHAIIDKVNDIPSTISNALQQAKDSGEFKGGTGDSGVYVGASAPTDESVNVWINPNGEVIDLPSGGSEDECDLLLDVTTTERVGLITQDIEPKAYKQIVSLVIATGHSDNSTAQYTAGINLRNAEGVEEHFNTAVPIHQNTAITYGKTLINLSPKYAYGSGQSNTHGINQSGMTNKGAGVDFYSWNTNVIDRITIDSGINTMEIGAQIKVWGYRA